MDKASFKAVDELYTAVQLRDSNLVERCAQRLKSLRSERKLPESACDALESMIAETHRSDWERARQHLRDFMLGQHR